MKPVDLALCSSATSEVDLNEALRGEWSEEYREPKEFFTVTYATTQLVESDFANHVGGFMIMLRTGFR